MILSSDQYSQADSYDLLCAADQGIVPVDQRLLHALLDEPAKSLPGILRYAGEERETRIDLSYDLLNIAVHLGDLQLFPILLNAVAQPEMIEPLIDVFARIGEPALEPLLELYGQTEVEGRYDLAYILARLRLKDERIFGILTAELAETADHIGEAAQCLAAYGDPAAIPLLEAALPRCTEEIDQRIVESAIETLRAGEREDSLHEPFNIWEIYPPETDPVFEVLSEQEAVAFLDSPNENYRQTAVMALSSPELPEDLWDRIFAMAKSDPSEAVRAECWEALTSAAARPDILAALKERVSSDAAPGLERMGALMALAIAGAPADELHEYLVEFYTSPELRSRAIEAMGATQDIRYSPYISDHIDDPDDDVRLAAIEGVGRLKLTEEVPRLVDYFDSELERSDALASYALAASCEPSRAGFRRLMEKLDKLAHGLDEEEYPMVCLALNVRAQNYGQPPVFDDNGEPIVDAPVAAPVKVGRNDPCPCGSGKKYKKCCG